MKHSDVAHAMPQVRTAAYRAIAFGIALLQAVSSSSALAADHHASGAIRLSTGVIFSEQAAHADGLCQPHACWTPGAREIDRLEQDLTIFLAHSRDRQAREILQNMSHYKRKYAGYKKRGRRFIVVNGLCARFWKEKSPHLMSMRRPGTDLGSCYFMIDYDVARRRFSRFYVDGEA